MLKKNLTPLKKITVVFEDCEDDQPRNLGMLSEMRFSREVNLKNLEDSKLVQTRKKLFEEKISDGDDRDRKKEDRSLKLKKSLKNTPIKTQRKMSLKMTPTSLKKQERSSPSASVKKRDLVARTMSDGKMHGGLRLSSATTSTKFGNKIKKIFGKFEIDMGDRSTVVEGVSPTPQIKVSAINPLTNPFVQQEKQKPLVYVKKDLIGSRQCEMATPGKADQWNKPYYGPGQTRPGGGVGSSSSMVGTVASGKPYE